MADGAAGFRQDSSGPALLRIPLRLAFLRVRAFHPLRTDFPDCSASNASPTSGSYNPGNASTSPVWAPPRSLAATWGIILIFSSCGYLDVSVPRVCPHFVGSARSRALGCPIRKSPDQWPFAPPRSLSQLITSFIAAKSQGIPCAPLVTYSVFSTRCFFLIKSSLTPAASQAAGSVLLTSACLLPVCQRTVGDLSPPAWRITDSNR